MSLPYYKRYPRDFLDGTIGMSLEEKGAYAVILDLIFATDGRLKDDANYIAGNLGCTARKWNSIKIRLLELGKISCDLGIISNSRADKILDEQRSFLEKQRENGGKAYKNKQLKKPSLTPSLEPKHSHLDTDTEEEEAKASSVSEPSVPRPITKMRCEEFDQVWALWPQKGRSAKSKSLALWKAKASTSDPALMLAAVKRYLAGPDAKKEAGAFVPALERWIRDRLESWLEVGVALQGPASADMQAKIFAETGLWLPEWGEQPQQEFQLLRGAQA